MNRCSPVMQGAAIQFCLVEMVMSWIFSLVLLGLLVRGHNLRVFSLFLRKTGLVFRAGHCEPFHKTVLQDYYQVVFKKKLYAGIENLHADLEEWIERYNTQRTHQGKMRCGGTPMETLIDVKSIWKKKYLN